MTKKNIKALTVSQPYASLIASGEKRVENRTWPTDYRGTLAIHAGTGRQYLTKIELEAYNTGCVIALCTLVDCVRLGMLARYWPTLHASEYAQGPWCWVLSDIRKIERYYIKGKRGLWDLSLPREFWRDG